MSRSIPFTTYLSRIWFPAGLLLLVFVGIPGAILLALNVFGLQADANAWLQRNVRLSYHMPLPLWAGFLLLLVPPLLVLLYFLKLKRKALQVPSTFLWKKSIEDLHVNTLFQWLRDNILLLLQILTVLALIYAVMAFQFHGSMTQGQHYILVIDNSASMSATDVQPNRLDQAKAEAIRIIDGHNDTDAGMVIVFNSSALILQSYTNERERLRNAVRSIQPTERPTRIEEALTLAASLANPTRSAEDLLSGPANADPSKARTYAGTEGIPTEVHFFTDGRFPDVREFTQGNLDMRLHLAGKPGRDVVDNVGLVTLNATRDETDPSKLQVLANVRNYRPEPAKVVVRMQVYVNGENIGKVLERTAQPQGLEGPDNADAQVPARAIVTLPPEPGKEDPSILDRPGEGLAAFELENVDDRASVMLEVSLANHNDAFALDNKAWLVVGVVRKARVLVVGGVDNPILDAFFNQEATKKVAQVSYITPDDLTSAEKYLRPARSGTYDLIVFDRCAPAKEEDLPVANTFFIDALPPPFKKDGLPTLTGPSIKGWPSKHPLMRYLAALYDVGIAEAWVFDLKDPRVPPRTPRLLESDKDVALMFALSRRHFTDLVMAFPIITDKGEWNTNWPLQPSFPLFMRNVLYTLGEVADAAGEERTQPGQVKALKPDAAVQEIEVTNPENEVQKLQRGNRAEFAFGKTDRVGVYGVRWDGGDRAFSVNLLDADESNIEPRGVGEIEIGTAEIKAEVQRTQPREVWKWVALVALLALLVEWYIYNRRIFV